MNKPLLKYSNLVNTRSKIVLYVSFIVLCSTVGIVYGLYLPLVPMSTVKMMLLPILILGLIGIWMMPEKEKFLENKLRAGLYTFLAFWCVWPPYLSLIKLPGDPWMSPQRILIYILLIISFLMFSVSRDAKTKLHDNYRNNKVIFLATLIFMFTSLISVFFSNDLNISITAFVKDMLFNFLVFFIAATIISHEKYLKMIFLICIFSALILGLMGIYENTLNQTIWSFHLPMSLFANTEDVQKILTPKFRFGDYRVKGSSLTSLEYAELLSYVLPMCLYYLLENKNKFFKIFILLLIFIMIYAIIVSRSRLGLVGALISLSSYSLLISIRNWHIYRHSLVGAAMMTLYPAGLAVMGILIALSTTLTNMIFGSSSSGHIDSTQARFDQWSMGLSLIAERPIFGYGLNMGASTLNYRTPGGTLTIDSFILSITLETGIIGGLAFILLFIAGSFKAAKVYILSGEKSQFTRMAGAVASILLTFLIIKGVLSQRYNHVLLFMLLGIVTSYRIHKNKTPND